MPMKGKEGLLLGTPAKMYQNVFLRDGSGFEFKLDGCVHFLAAYDEDDQKNQQVKTRFRCGLSVQHQFRLFWTCTSGSIYQSLEHERLAAAA